MTSQQSMPANRRYAARPIERDSAPDSDVRDIEPPDIAPLGIESGAAAPDGEPLDERASDSDLTPVDQTVEAHGAQPAYLDSSVVEELTLRLPKSELVKIIKGALECGRRNLPFTESDLLRAMTFGSSSVPARQPPRGTRPSRG